MKLDDFYLKPNYNQYIIIIVIIFLRYNKDFIF